jgi:hypothetical protein
MLGHKNLRWIWIGSVLLTPAAASLGQESLPGPVQQVLKKHCYECHGGKRKLAKLDILDYKLMIQRKVLVPGKGKESELLVRLLAKDDSVMPPPERERLSTEELNLLQSWVEKGTVQEVAKAAPVNVPEVKPAEQAPADEANLQRPLGAGYIHQAILQDIRRFAAEERKNFRYFSLTHLLGGGITREELVGQREALAKAINHLSWKPKLVRPTPVESTFTVYRVDLRELGWDRPLQRKISAPGAKAETSAYNLYDLVLLEYPYGVIHHGEPYVTLCKEFLLPAGQVRPVSYVRGDWFASVATQPPLYHDLMQLPLSLGELESKLGVNAEDNLRTGRALRGGVIVSGVSRNNRVNERHPARFGYYWKSFDFKSSQAQENIFLDPVNLNQSGGEMIFSLPNGMQGYYVCNEKGVRLDFAPTNIVVDTFASDKTVRNGLACMRCHDKGTKPFADVVRPILTKLQGKASFDVRLALQLYRDQSSLDRFLTGDQDRFQKAMKQLLGKEAGNEPLRPVSRRFLDDRIQLASASAELGLPEPKNLSDVFQRPQFLDVGLAPLAAGQPLARDAWEVYYDRVVRLMGLGHPLVNLDALTRTDYSPTMEPPFTLEAKTNKRGNTFEPSDELIVFVKANKNVYVEIVGTSARGNKVILVPSTTYLKAGQQFRYPPEGKKLMVPKGPAQEHITILASLNPFPAGEIYTAPYVADRLVHPYRVVLKGNQVQVQVSPDPIHTVKRTIPIEIR